MAEQNNFWIDLVAALQKSKSKKQIKSDTKSLGDIYVKLIGNLDMPKTRKAIKNQLKGTNFTFNMTPTVNTKGVQKATQQAVNNAQKVAGSNKVHINFDVDKQKLVNQIKILGRNNNKLFNNQEMTVKYNQLLNSANVAKSSKELKNLRGQLSAFRTELVATNNAGMTWGSKFKASIQRYAQFFSGASVIYSMVNQLKNAGTEAKSLDDRLVDLMKVTDEIENRDSLYKYFDRAMSKAKDLNVKVDSLLYAITEFKKTGNSLGDAEVLGSWATVLQNVGDLDIDTAIGSIKTSMASFEEIGGYGNDQMEKKVEAYTDLINEMSNKYSIDANGLAEAIRISAGTLTEAHTSIEEAATMFATANKYYNDPDYLGNTAKIGSLRLRASSDSDAKEELEAMGESIDDVEQSASKLQEKLLALTGVNIMEEDNTTFKSYYDQLYEISQVIDDLSDTSRANVLETLFGKNRAAAGTALISGMKNSADAYETAINSAGSATEEYQVWMQSADAATQRFSNTLTETYQSIINGNTVRDLARMSSAVLDFANSWGIVEGTLKGVIVLGLGKFLTTGTMALITATKQTEQYGKALQLVNNIPNGNLSARYQTLKNIAQATNNLTGVQLKHVLANKALSQQDRIRILQMQGMTREMAIQKLAEMNLTSATNAQTAANTASTASTFSLKAAMVGLGATIKSVFLSNPVGIALMAISIGVSAVTSAVSKHNQRMEEMREEAEQAADEANTLGDEVAELASKYIALSEAVNTDSSAKEDLMTTQTELVKKLGLEGESIDTLIEKYGSLSNAIKQASIDSLKKSQLDLIAGVDVTRDELLDVAEDNFWGTNNILSATGDEAVKAFKELEKAGVIDSGSFGTGGGQLVLIGDETVEGALENYKRLEDALTALRDSEAFTAEELSNNSLYQSIYGRYSEMKDEVEAYNSSIDNLNENLAQQTMLSALQGQEIPKTEQDFEVFRQELIDTATASKQFIGNEKEITDAINNYLSTVPEFEGYYSIPLENELDKVDALLGQEDFSKTFTLSGTQKEALETYQSTLSSVESFMDKLSDKSFDAESLDLATVMQKFSDYDWTNVLDGTETLTQALEKIGNDAYETLKKSFDPDDPRLTQLMTEWKNGLAKAINSNSDYDKTISEYNALKDVLSKVKTGYVFSAEEITELISKHNDLADAVKITDNGYTLEEEAITSLVNEFAQLSNESIAAEMERTKSNIETAKINIGLIDDEISRLNKLKTAREDLESKYGAPKIKGNPSLINIPLDNMISSAENKKADELAKIEDYNEKYKELEEAFQESLKTGGSTSSSSTIIDWYAERIDNLDHIIDEFNSKMENLKGSASKNSVVDAIIGANQDKLTTYQAALKGYTDKASEALAAVPDVYKELAKTGGHAITKFIDDKSVVKAIQEYQDWADKISETSSSIEELNTQLRQLELDKFNNIADDYSKLKEVVESNTSLIEAQISLLETKGSTVGKSFYDEMINNARTNISLLQEERQKLSEQMSNAMLNGISIGSDEWQEMNSAINEVTLSIIESSEKIEDYQNKIDQLHWDTFDKANDALSNLSDEIKSIIDLLDIDTVLDTDGAFSKDAVTAMALYAEQLETAKYQISKYNDEIAYLNDEYSKGTITSEEFAEKLQELNEGQWDSVSAYKAAKDAIIELRKQGIEEELDALEELYDARKKAWEQEKEQYDWEKTKAESNKNISDLESQIRELSNDNSLAGIKKRLELEQKLEEAKSDWESELYDHELSEREKQLDQDYDNRKEALENSLKDEESLLNDTLETINNNSAQVFDKLSAISQEYGIKMSDSIVNAFTKGGNALDGYSTLFSEAHSNFTSQINDTVTNIYAAQAQADSASASIVQMFNSANGTLNEQVGILQGELNGVNYELGNLSSIVSNLLNGNYENNNLIKALNTVKDTMTSLIGEADKVVSKTSNKNSGGGGASSSFTQIAYSDRGYASGTRSATKGLHPTFENGIEVIAKDGKLLVPYSGGETIFSNEQLEKLWNWSNDNMNLNTTKFVMPDVSKLITRKSSNIVQNIESLITVKGDMTPDVLDQIRSDKKIVQEIKNIAMKGNIEALKDTGFKF